MGLAQGKVASLFVEFRATVNQFAGDMAQISREVRQFDRIVSPIGRRVGELGFALSAGLTAPLIGAGALALKTGIDFESAFAGVKKTVEASDEQLAVLRQQLIDLSQTVPVSATEFAKIATAAGQLGIEAPNIARFSQTMAELESATNLTAVAGGKALARFTNITKLPEDQIHNLASSLALLGDRFAADEAEILNFAQRMASVGKIVGLNSAEILGFATAFRDVGVRAESGGTAITRVMAEISKAVLDGGTKLEQFASVADVSFEEFSELFRTKPSEAIAIFVEGLQRIRVEGGNVFKTLEAMGLQNVRIRDTLLSLAEGGDIARRAVTTANDEFEKNTHLSREVAERNKTVAAQFKILKDQIDAVSISLFDTFLPTINNSIIPALKRLVDEGIKPAVNAFRELPDSTQNFITGMVLIAVAIGPAILLINKLVYFIGGLGIILGRPVTIFATLAGIIGEFTAAIQLAAGATGIGAFIAAITAPLAIPWWLSAIFYIGLVKSVYDLATAYRDLVNAREESDRAQIGSDNALLQGIANLRKRGINIALPSNERSIDEVRKTFEAVGLAQQAIAKSSERVAAMQAEAAKATEQHGRASRLTAEEIEEQAKAAEELQKEHERLIQRFVEELAPANALNQELDFLMRHFSASQIVAVYGERIVDAADAQREHGIAVAGATAQLYDQAKALQTVRNLLEEIRREPVEGIPFPITGGLPGFEKFTATSLPTAGLKVPGNLDIFNRPIVDNLDGTKSTIRSISVEFEHLGEVLIPTISRTGQMLTDLQAIQEFERTGEHLGIFETVDAANAYADALHRQQEELGKIRAFNPITAEALKTYFEAKKQIDDLSNSINRLGFFSPEQQIFLLSGSLDAAAKFAKVFNIELSPAIINLLKLKDAAELAAAGTKAWEDAANAGLETADEMASQIATTAEAIKRMQAAQFDHNAILEILGGTIDTAAENIEKLGINIEELDPALQVFIRFRQLMNEAKEEASELEKEMARITTKIVNDLANGIADALLSGKSLIDTATKIGKDFAAAFVRAVISGVVQPLVEKFSELGRNLGKIISNLAAAHPVIAGIVAAAVAAVTVIRALGNTHVFANQFVQETQNPFGDSLQQFVDTANTLYAAGRQTYQGAQDAETKVREMWQSFLKDAQKFGEEGRKQATVAAQAISTLEPVVRQVIFGIQKQIESLKPPSIRVIESVEQLNIYREAVARNTEEYIAGLQEQMKALDDQIQWIQIQIAAQEYLGNSTEQLNKDLQELIFQWNDLHDAMNPVIPTIYDFAEAVRAVSETLVPDKTLEFVEQVINATAGAANLEKALSILEEIRTPVDIIIDRLGDDLEDFANALLLSGLPISPLIEKYLKLKQAQEELNKTAGKTTQEMPRIANSLSKLVGDAVEKLREIAGGGDLAQSILDALGRLLTGLPAPGSKATTAENAVKDAVDKVRVVTENILAVLQAEFTPSVAGDFSVAEFPVPAPAPAQVTIIITDNGTVNNENYFTDEISREMVRDVVIPEITEALTNNTDSVQEKWTRRLRSVIK